MCYHDFSMRGFTHRARWPASEWPSSPVRACSWIVSCWCMIDTPAAATCVSVHWTDPSPRSPSLQEAVLAGCFPLPSPPLAPAPSLARCGRRRHGSCCSSSACPPGAAQSPPPVPSLGVCATGIPTAGWAWRELKALHSAARKNYTRCKLILQRIQSFIVVFKMSWRSTSYKQRI